MVHKSPPKDNVPKRVEIDDGLHAIAESKCPKYLSVTGFINLILDQGLDRGVTLTERATASTQEGGASEVSSYSINSINSSSNKELSINKKEGVNSKKPKAKRTKGSPEFETFWASYQAIGHRANKQAKPQAWEVWKQLIDDGVKPEDLSRALKLASDDVSFRLTAGEFASPFPDCFRWLRDECYAVYLESHQSNSNSSNRISFL